jgi:hypothetical protein
VGTITGFMTHLGYMFEAMGEFLVYFWPVSVAAVAIGVPAFTVGKPFRDLRLRRIVPFAALSYSVPLVFLVAGAVLRYDGPAHPYWREPPAWRAYLLWSFVVIQAVLVVAALIRAKSRGARAAGVLIPPIWLSVCALVPALLSVTGESF